MEKTSVIDKNGNVKAEIELPEEVFGYPVKTHLLYEAATNFESNQRRGTAATKTRAMVSGSNRKPWRQKGTGRARAGATRSPLWRHGGTTFGPRPKDYGTAFPKDANRNALRSALAAKHAEKKLLVVDDLALDAPKTKDAARLLKTLKVSSAVIVEAPANVQLFAALRNIPKVKAVTWERLNTHDVLKYAWFVASRQAFLSLMERLK
jgi:large subunit ribosomal protein L4